MSQIRSMRNGRRNLDSIIKYDKKGAKFNIEEETNASTIATRKYIFFGRVDVELQAAPGQGIVTAIVLQSDTLDEIDWEWLGGDATQVQSNYFSKGDTTTYDRGDFHDVTEPLTTFHTYSIEWNKNVVQWIIDGNVIRTPKAADAKGFPQSPMQIKLGTWCAGGSQTEQGTVEWAGGLTDLSKAPFNAYYKSVTIVDYAGGDGPVPKSVNEYVYGDNWGSADSIKVKYGSSFDSEEKTSDKNKSEPIGTEIETDASREKDDQSNSTISKPNGGLVSLNFTATPVGTPVPGNTGPSGQGSNDNVPQSVASRGTIREGFIAGTLFLVDFAA
ncbi:concanavalin A-like lectin/glucanase domain-containing protein [Fusarium redolens]|uniref:Concanavalin A-like lectin/glucanase domain-containing protein n=1 Tax=Fusarium redolens TaxID=48865 RepID=A0A9P9FZS4_FUSRE|nr:concanavalin A-like lectin/glucanase domain-containing protein [Fusarium redolens]KAH7227196.1 concanavalin A-like lectin/glucanase domain-containing protein [Fusarium redolens]